MASNPIFAASNPIFAAASFRSATTLSAAALSAATLSATVSSVIYHQKLNCHRQIWWLIRGAPQRRHKSMSHPRWHHTNQTSLAKTLTSASLKMSPNSIFAQGRKCLNTRLATHWTVCTQMSKVKNHALGFMRIPAPHTPKNMGQNDTPVYFAKSIRRR